MCHVVEHVLRLFGVHQSRIRGVLWRRCLHPDTFGGPSPRSGKRRPVLANSGRWTGGDDRGCSSGTRGASRSTPHICCDHHRHILRFPVVGHQFLFHRGHFGPSASFDSLVGDQLQQALLLRGVSDNGLRGLTVIRRATFEIRLATARDSRRRRPRGRTRREGFRRETYGLYDVGLRGRHGWRAVRRVPRSDLSPIRLRPHLRYLHRADVHLWWPRNVDGPAARGTCARVDAAVPDDSLLQRFPLPDHLRRALLNCRPFHATGHRRVSERLAVAPVGAARRRRSSRGGRSVVTTLLSVDRISKAFGGLQALNECSLSVEKGSITGLIGPNGSGKTTLFNVITGYEKPDSGSVTFEEADITRVGPSKVFALGVGRTFQITRIFGRITVLENMLVATQRDEGWLRGLTRSKSSKSELASAMEWLLFMGRHRLASQPAGSRSFGPGRPLGLAYVLVADPDVILLDEPAGGVNLTLINEIAGKIQTLNKDGKSFLIVEHNMEFVMNLCDRVTVMHQGADLVSGTPSEIRSNPLVLDAYLGGSDEDDVEDAS